MADGLHVFGSQRNSFDWYHDDGVSTAYQRGEYDHLSVEIDGDAVTIERKRGDLTPKRLIWVRDKPVTRVTVDGVETGFEADGRTISVPLGPFGEQTTVEVD
jgi:hypothetical protein